MTLSQARYLAAMLWLQRTGAALGCKHRMHLGTAQDRPQRLAVVSPEGVVRVPDKANLPHTVLVSKQALVAVTKVKAPHLKQQKHAGTCKDSLNAPQQCCMSHSTSANCNHK